MKFILFNLILGFWLPNSYGQKSEFAAISDSLLYQKDLNGALKILSLSIEKSNKIDLRKKYLTSISEYQRNFNAEQFPITKSIIDTILNEENLAPIAKQVYLYHFMSSFSRRVLTNEERILYCDQGLMLTKESIPIDTMFLIHFMYEKAISRSVDLEYQEAIEEMKTLESLCNSFSDTDPNMLPKIYYRLAILHRKIEASFVGKGYEYLEKAEQSFLALDRPDTFALAMVYGLLSDVAWDFRDYEKGLSYVRKYKTLNAKIDLDRYMDPTEQIENKYHLLYKEMQFYLEDQKEMALKTLMEAEKDCSAYLDNDNIRLSMAAMYNMMGELYIRSAPEISAPYYKKAIETLNQKLSIYHLQFLFNLGKATLYSGKAQESLTYSNELVDLAEEHNQTNLPHYYFLKALAYIKLKNFDQALEISYKALKNLDPSCNLNLITHEGLHTFKPIVHHVVNINLLSKMGLEFLNGFPNDTKALSTANALFQLGIMEYGKSIKASKVTNYTKRMYEDLVWGIINTKVYLKPGGLSFAELIEFSENTNEKYLWTIHKSNNDPEVFFEPELLEKEASIRTELVQLKQAAISDTSIDLNQKIFDINLELEKIDQQKRKTNSSYYDFEEAVFSYETFRSKIEPGDLILKYEFILDSLYLYSITRDEIFVSKIQQDYSLLDNIELTYNMISNPLSDVDSLKEKLELLATILLPEIDSEISNVFIKADGKLNLLPYDLLIKNGEYLIENYNIGYISALGLYENMTGHEFLSNALVISPSYNNAVNVEGLLAERGDEFNLSGALEEASVINKILKGNMLLEEDALKSKFLKIAADYDLLHFSMHSMLNDTDPELSNLVFHDGESNNKLFISELYGMKLNAHMAVLSACNTGIGEEVRGDGIVSLNRAFTFAGVPSVISSLWSAPDHATKEIMVDFYENLDAGSAKPIALRNAKMEYLNSQKNERFEHPYYWAGFVTYNDPSPTKMENKIMNFNFLIIAACLFLIGFGLFWIRNKGSRIIASKTY
ncbi:CHAT domain-containing protein [Portibacter lacus]|uniref:CHAT domain-containing protein n=1 Tax=Portibacter lacus TaxID=1099794 RepID=UPI001F1F7AF0|nr:CHAT domain-containing protein [Portibacter lacus]